MIGLAIAIGWALGFLGAWAYFHLAGLFRTREEFLLARHFGKVGIRVFAATVLERAKKESADEGCVDPA